MKKILKIIALLILNISLFIMFFFIAEYLTYKKAADPVQYLKDHPLSTEIPSFKYYLRNPNITYVNLEGYFNGSDNIFQGRKPDGIEYKNSKPIVIFGDSFAHGQYLNYNQNLSYKLAHKLNRTVYNRAIPGSSLQHMYYQVSDANSTFYNEVPPSDTVFYVMINDHYLRMSIFSDFDTLGGNFYLRYTIKNNKLVKDNYENILLNFVKSSYIVRAINCKYVDRYIVNPKNADKLTNLAVKYLIETRNCLENKWNRKINFIVLLYDNNKITFEKQLRDKLEKNNFTVISTSDLTTEDLNSETYLMQDNLHPKEAAWNLLIPKLLEKIF